MRTLAMKDVGEVLEKVKAELAALSERLARLEALTAVASSPAAAKETSLAPPPAPNVSEEEVLAISAALAAYLGVRLHIRQIRLVSSAAWAQQGRVSIQASHRLHN
jgi:methylmalonyl-CoA carboxyltransferase 12S subunit